MSQLSEEDKETARNQRIPSLLQLLNLAKQHNISVIFDLYSPDQEGDTNDTVSTILSSGIDPSLVSLIDKELFYTDIDISWFSFAFPPLFKILWLPPAEREIVNLIAPGFIQVYNNEEEMLAKGGDHLNVKYSMMKTDKIR